MKQTKLNEKQNEIIEKLKFSYPDIININEDGEIEVNTSAKSIQYYLDLYLSNLHEILHEKYDDSRIRWNLGIICKYPDCRGLMASIFLHLNISDNGIYSKKYNYPTYEFIMNFADESQSIWIDEGDRMNFIYALS